SHVQSIIDHCGGRVHQHLLRGLHRPRGNDRQQGRGGPDPEQRVDLWSSCRAAGGNEEVYGGLGTTALMTRTSPGLVRRPAQTVGGAAQRYSRYASWTI